MIDKMILGFLMYEEMTGYEIKKQMDNSTSYFYKASYGSINPALKKLEKGGMATSLKTIENGRVKHIYSITDKGREEFINWLQNDIPPSPAKEESLLRVFFFGHIPMNKSIELIENYIESVKNVEHELHGLKKFIIDNHCHNEEEFETSFHMATLRFGIDYYEFVRNWFADYVSKLKTNETRD